MPLSRFLSRFGGRDASRRTPIHIRPQLAKLESREVLNGYIAVGAGQGALPLVAIRVDKVDLLGGQPPNPAGQPPAPGSDGRTDFTTQIFQPFPSAFRGGLHVASGNFDGSFATPDFLVTAAGVGGGPHVKVWTMVQDNAGNITVGGLFTEFFAYTPAFTGGVNVTAGDLDGDGRSELIVGAGPGGGPHVKVYKLDISDRRAVLVNEFMAYDPNFRGGVNVASGQGYQTPFQVVQQYDAPHPDGFYGVASPFDPIGGVPQSAYNAFGAIRPGEMTVPNGFGGFTPIPLAENYLFQADDGSLEIRGQVTVGSGTIQYVGANLLNNYGNIAYEPNVADLVPPIREVPPEQPLVYAMWTGTNADIPVPPGLQPNVVYGPFIQTQPAINSLPPQVTPFSAPAGQVNSRNQLVTGPGVGGGPLVRVWDFLGQANGLIAANEMIQFNAFDPNFRGGINVSIGSFIDLPNAGNGQVVPDTFGQRLGDVSFPFDPNIYRQFSAQIAVTPASGAGSMVLFSDLKPNPRTRRTSISQLNMVGTVLDTVTVFDPNNPLGNFQSIVNVNALNGAIDPQFRGQIFTTASALLFDGSAGTATAQHVFGAGASTGPSRGTRVRIFGDLGPADVTLPGPVGTSLAHDPIDDFQAFLSGQFPTGIGGVSFGFGRLDAPTLDVLALPSIALPSTVTDPRYRPPV